MYPEDQLSSLQSLIEISYHIYLTLVEQTQGNKKETEKFEVEMKSVETLQMNLLCIPTKLTGSTKLMLKYN